MDDIEKEPLKAKLQVARENCKFYIDLYVNALNNENNEFYLNNIKYYQGKIEELKVKLLDCDDDEVDTWNE